MDAVTLVRWQQVKEITLRTANQVCRGSSEPEGTYTAAMAADLLFRLLHAGPPAEVERQVESAVRVEVMSRVVVVEA